MYVPPALTNGSSAFSPHSVSLIDAGKEVGGSKCRESEVYAAICHKNAGQNHYIKAANRYLKMCHS
jgi:hypothetical protein